MTIETNKLDITKSAVRKFLHKQESSIILALDVYIVFVSCVNSTIISSGNIFNIFRSSGFALITISGMTLILITAGLDLSVESVLALGGVVSGINTRKTKCYVYMLTSALAGLAGVFMAARLGSGEAATGTGYELTVICGVSVVVISSEISEPLAICDRFVVLGKGLVQKVLSKEEASEVAILRASSNT